MAQDIPFVPRFYIDEIQYMKALGLLKFEEGGNVGLGNTEGLYGLEDFDYRDASKLFNFNPTDYFHMNTQGGDWLSGTDKFSISMPTIFKNEGDFEQRKYFAVLGHNFKDADMSFQVSSHFPNRDEDDDEVLDLTLISDQTTEIINSLAWAPDYPQSYAYNGFSIDELTTKPSDNIEFRMSYNQVNIMRKFGIGAISFGSIFDLSISPDLNLRMSYEYGVDEKESRSGSTLSNVRWWQKPLWVDQGAWELDEDGESKYFTEERDLERLKHRRSGRRVYDLTFTFMTGDELLATNPNLSTTSFVSGDLSDNGSDVFDNHITLFSDNSFYSQVVHKTLGFSIPFIFQPNKDSNNPQDFMLAKIDSKKGWELEQIAPSLFRTKLRIKEVW